MMNTEVVESTNLREDEMAKHIVAATKETFEVMVSMDITDKYPLEEPVTKFHCSVSGLVGLAGIYTGMLSLHCPEILAMKITSNMLGMEVDKVGEDVSDAIGEIANMLTGHVKQILSKGGLDLNLSIPTVISGETYTFNAVDDNDCVVIPFDCEGDVFLVGLTLRKG